MPEQKKISELIKLAESRDINDNKIAIKGFLSHEGDNKLIIKTLLKLITHRSLKIRSLAHEALKEKADEDTYLKATVSFLYDTREDVKCSAIKILCEAEYMPALSYIIGFLSEKNSMIRKTAAEGIFLFGYDAMTNLLKRRKATRPDKRECISKVIDRINKIP